MSVKMRKADREKELFRLYLTQAGREKLAKLLQSYEDLPDGAPLPEGTSFIQSILLHEYPPEVQ